MSVASAPPAAPATLDVDGVAAQLGLNQRTIRRAVADGRLGHLRVGRCLRFRQDHVDAFVAARTVEVPAADAYADHIARLVEAAPPLTDAQRQRLAALLRPVAQ